MSTRPVAALKTCGRVALLPTGCRPTVPYLRAMAFCVIWSADCLLLIAICGEVWETRSVFQVGCGQAEDPEGRPSACCPRQSAGCPWLRRLSAVGVNLVRIAGAAGSHQVSGLFAQSLRNGMATAGGPPALVCPDPPSGMSHLNRGNAGRILKHRGLSVRQCAPPATGLTSSWVCLDG